MSMEFFLLINVKMPTIVGILTFISGKNSIPDLSKPKKKKQYFYEHLRFHTRKKFYNLGPDTQDPNAICLAFYLFIYLFISTFLLIFTLDKL